MTGLNVLIAVTAILVVLGIAELALHRRRLATIRYRIHVNGTRGKSSVTRLIAAGLRAGDITTCAKTTGSTARMILPDGRELPIYRPGGANIIEQKRIVAVAAAYQAEALVIECMALQPLLQSLSELKLIQATHGVITNARPDHLEVMGPGERDVARAMAGMTPVGGTLYTAETEQLKVLERAAKDRGTKLCVIEPLVDEEVLSRFRHTEHGDNVALALKVCADLGVDREVALDGMVEARSDPGAMTERQVDFFGRKITFVNGFAANDPVSTKQGWMMASSRHDELARRIAVFNCRADRPERSVLLGKEFASWPKADHVVLMGTGTHVFAHAATNAGLDPGKLVFAEELPVEQVFERIVALVDDSALVMGMGNIGEGGLRLANYFRNRALPERT
ncbi:MAG: poly-gamma-glutamate synthase PgsB [Deltaproteobacteria bacterium]|nr:poly-gamma-glutamate synthase PgsB [Deltaproteobacteria bacterium]